MIDGLMLQLGVDIFSWLPTVAVLAIGLLAAFFIFTIARMFSQPAPGIAMGHFEIIGNYAGGKYVNRIRGLMVEATKLFMNEQMEPKFKESLGFTVDAIAKKSGFDQQLLNDIKAWKTKLQDAKLCELMRIIVTRDGATKHLIVQYDRVKQSLLEYVRYDEKGKMTLQGTVSQGVVTGQLTTFKGQWKVHNVGKCTVHLFKPDLLEPVAAGTDNPPKIPEELAKLMLLAPALVEAQELIKSRDDLLKAKEEAYSELRRMVSGNQTLADSAKKVVAAWPLTPGGKLPDLFPKKLDVIDAMALTLPTLLLYYITLQSKVEPVIGIIVGLFIGIFTAFKRH